MVLWKDVQAVWTNSFLLILCGIVAYQQSKTCTEITVFYVIYIITILCITTMNFHQLNSQFTIYNLTMYECMYVKKTGIIVVNSNSIVLFYND